MGAGIGLFLGWENGINWGYWDWDLAAGNGK